MSGFAGPWRQIKPALTPWILEAIEALNFVQMTPVQASTIPLFMQHKDVVVEAVTGSGKTLAFLIPVLERLLRRENTLKDNEIGSLIISPTRELAAQIFSVLSHFVKAAPDNVRCPVPLLLVSGTTSTPADDMSRFLELKADIVIGTPGRIEEFLIGKRSEHVSVREFEVLVLDEADRLLDLGFSTSITRIIQHLPKQRRTGLFSATMTDGLSELVKVGLRNPVRVVVKVESKRLLGLKRRASDSRNEQRTPASLSSYYLHCLPEQKTARLLDILFYEKENSAAKAIVYFATCASVDYFYRIFSRLASLRGFTFFSLHGHLPPEKRSLSLSSFARSLSTPKTPSVLLCTDVAARGLDLPDVDVVIQYDCPMDTKAFSHRAGRTARMGREGRAWVILVGRELDYVDLLRVRRVPLVKGYPTIGKDQEAGSLLEAMRGIVLQDRDFHEKGVKAFVSFTRAYSKHEAVYIFNLKHLDLVGIAKSYGLLQLPRMPELRGHTGDWTDAEVDWPSYSYANKAREAKRLRSGQEERAKATKERQRHTDNRKKNAPWSQKAEKKEIREKRRQKQFNRQVQTGSSIEGNFCESDADVGMADWRELAEENKAARKAKRARVIAEGDTKAFLDL